MTETQIYWVDPDKGYKPRDLNQLRDEVARIEKAIRDWRHGILDHKSFLQAKKRHRQFKRSTVVELNSTDEAIQKDATEVVKRNEAAVIHGNLVERSARLLNNKLSASFSVVCFGDQEFYAGGDDPVLIREQSLKADLSISQGTAPFKSYPFPGIA